MVSYEGRTFTGSTIGDATDEFCKLIAQELIQKLRLDEGFTLRLSFFSGDTYISTKTLGT